MTEVQANISKRLKEIRAKRNMTQAQVAKLAGIHPNAYAKIERGDRSATIVTLSKIVKALGVHSSDVLPF